MTLLAQGAQHGEAIHVRQHQVEQDQLGIPPTRLRQPFEAVGRDPDLVAVVGQVESQPFGQARIVLDHQNSAHRHSPVVRGSVTRKHAPCGATVLELHRAVMQQDQLADDGEADAAAAALASLERLPDPLAILRRDARPLIRHGELEDGGIVPRAHRRTVPPLPP